MPGSCGTRLASIIRLMSLSDDKRWERYLSKVEKVDSGCWIWTGWKNQHGYGIIRVDYREVRAHRAFYERFVGPIPPGMGLMHSCDTPSCVNPEHLSPGTQTENMRDAAGKGRIGGAPGENARKTHCKRGHLFTQEEGRRRCYVCLLENQRRRYAEGYRRPSQLPAAR